MTDGNLNTFTEKRQSCRLSLPLQVYINSRKQNSDRLHNISEGGACFRSSNSFNTDDFIFFHFQGDEESEIEGAKFAILGKIVWCEEREGCQTNYGAEFVFHENPFSEQQQAKMMSVITRYDSDN